jgi:hypothetical protein
MGGMKGNMALFSENWKELELFGIFGVNMAHILKLIFKGICYIEKERI